MGYPVGTILGGGLCPHAGAGWDSYCGTDTRPVHQCLGAYVGRMVCGGRGLCSPLGFYKQRGMLGNRAKEILGDYLERTTRSVLGGSLQDDTSTRWDACCRTDTRPMR